MAIKLVTKKLAAHFEFEFLTSRFTAYIISPHGEKIHLMVYMLYTCPTLIKARFLK